jgi:hypothetical protein
MPGSRGDCVAASALADDVRAAAMAQRVRWFADAPKSWIANDDDSAVRNVALLVWRIAGCADTEYEAARAILRVHVGDDPERLALLEQAQLADVYGVEAEKAEHSERCLRAWGLPHAADEDHAAATVYRVAADTLRAVRAPVAATRRRTVGATPRRREARPRRRRTSSGTRSAHGPPSRPRRSSDDPEPLAAAHGRGGRQ